MKGGYNAEMMMKKEIESYDRVPSDLRRFLSGLIPEKIRAKRWELKRKARGWKTKEEFFAEKARNGGRVNKKL